MAKKTSERQGITGWQIKKIHALIGAMKLDDGIYRVILFDRFRVESSKELTTLQAQQLIEELEAKAISDGVWEKRTCIASPASRYQGRNQGKKFDDLEQRSDRMATPPQLRKIEAMWQEVSRAPEPAARKKALRSFMERVAKVSDLRFLDMEGAGKVINALTAMQKPGTRKKAV